MCQRRHPKQALDSGEGVCIWLAIREGSMSEIPMKELACIVLPTYREAKNLAILLPRIFAQEARIATHQLHVLVVDDNSPDGTRALVEELRQKYPGLHLLTGDRKGLGIAYQR